MTCRDIPPRVETARKNSFDRQVRLFPLRTREEGTLKTRKPIIRVPGACAGGGTAFWTAKRMMENSDFNNVLVVGVEKLHGHTKNNEKIIDEFSMAMESRWWRNTYAELTPDSYFVSIN